MEKVLERVVKTGDIVTIIGDNTMYVGKQGEVVEINDEDGEPDGPIGVKFDACQMMFYVDPRHPEECVVRHKDDELQVDTAWSCATLAERFYRGYYHTTLTFKFPFSPSLPCMRAGCGQNAVRRGVINEWGNVHEIDLCETHIAEDQGKLYEAYPWKKDYPFPPKQEVA